MNSPTEAVAVQRDVDLVWAATIFERTRNAGIADARSDERIRWTILVHEAHDIAERAFSEAERGCLGSAVALTSSARMLLAEAQHIRRPWTASSRPGPRGGNTNHWQTTGE